MYNHVSVFLLKWLMINQKFVIKLNAPFRRATQDDAKSMAELTNMAGEGLPYYLWGNMADTHQTAWQVGHERAKRETGAFSYTNTIIKEDSGVVVGCLIGYPLEDNSVPSNYQQLPAMFVPMQQLEDMVPNSWYLNVLAVYPHFQGQGVGQSFLQLAETIVFGLQIKAISLLVSDINTEAIKLYKKNDYKVIAKREMIKDGWENSGKHWVLMLKELTV